MRFIKALVVLVIWVPWFVTAEEAPEAEDIPQKVSLKVSVQGGSFNAKFKFFDASEGCPSYVDIPGAKHYLGGVRASDSGAKKKLKRESPVHILMFSPRDTPGITAGGGDANSRGAPLMTPRRRRGTTSILSGSSGGRLTSGRAICWPLSCRTHRRRMRAARRMACPRMLIISTYYTFAQRQHPLPQNDDDGRERIMRTTPSERCDWTHPHQWPYHPIRISTDN